MCTTGRLHWLRAFPPCLPTNHFPACELFARRKRELTAPRSGSDNRERLTTSPPNSRKGVLSSRGVTAISANREVSDDHEAGPHFPCIAQTCDGSASGKRRLYAVAQSGFLEAGCARGGRRQPVLLDLQPDRPHRDDAEQGRRISSLRLERLLVGTVAACRPRLRRAALSRHPRNPLLAHL